MHHTPFLPQHNFTSGCNKTHCFPEAQMWTSLLCNSGPYSSSQSALQSLISANINTSNFTFSTDFWQMKIGWHSLLHLPTTLLPTVYCSQCVGKEPGCSFRSCHGPTSRGTDASYFRLRNSTLGALHHEEKQGWNQIPGFNNIPETPLTPATTTLHISAGCYILQ